MAKLRKGQSNQPNTSAPGSTAAESPEHDGLIVLLKPLLVILAGVAAILVIKVILG